MKERKPFDEEFQRKYNRSHNVVLWIGITLIIFGLIGAVLIITWQS